MSRTLGIIGLFITVFSIQTLHAQFAVVSAEFLFEEGVFFEQCHASTLEESEDGILLASWFGGTHEGSEDVAIWGVRLIDGKWTDPEMWANGETEDEKLYPCWNPVLFRPNNTHIIYLYYKVGPNPREWWGMVKTSDDGGETWSTPVKLPNGIFGPIKNRPLQLMDGSVLSPSSVEFSEDRWFAHVEWSDDDQATWKTYPIDHSSVFNVIQPSIIQHVDGRLQVLCRSKEGVVASAWSTDGGKNWSRLEKTNLLNPNSGTDAIRVGDRIFIVYNPGPPGDQWWEGRAKLRLAWSKDGMDWTDILVLENEDKGEFSYPTVIQSKDGLIHITYTYNRKNIKHVTLRLDTDKINIFEGDNGP
ncbi:MAG: sialidase family protein [Sphingobacterium sp.]